MKHVSLEEYRVTPRFTVELSVGAHEPPPKRQPRRPARRPRYILHADVHNGGRKKARNVYLGLYQRHEKDPRGHLLYDPLMSWEDLLETRDIGPGETVRLSRTASFDGGKHPYAHVDLWPVAHRGPVQGASVELGVKTQVVHLREVQYPRRTARSILYAKFLARLPWRAVTLAHGHMSQPFRDVLRSRREAIKRMRRSPLA